MALQAVGIAGGLVKELVGVPGNGNNRNNYNLNNNKLLRVTI